MLITRTSSAVDYIVTDIFLGRVNVKFANGHWYRYTNVSRRAILNLELNPNMSLGFWVNDNIINSARVKQAFGVNLALAWRLHWGTSVLLCSPQSDYVLYT